MLRLFLLLLKDVLQRKYVLYIVFKGNLKIVPLTNVNKYLYEKGKAVPLPAWIGPQVSRKLRFPDFLTTAQDGCKVVSLAHWPHLSPGNTPGTHLC
jgi:hypothetical protein